MKVAVDVDGTVDADPAAFQSLCSSLVAAGHRVIMLTGTSNPVTRVEKKRKEGYLRSLGFTKGAAFTKLKVVPNPPEGPKADYCRRKKIAILIDNNTKTARLAAYGTTVLVPWASRTGLPHHA